MIFSKALSWRRVEMAHFHMYLRLELSIALHYCVISCNTVYPALIRGIKDVYPFSQHAQGFKNMLNMSQGQTLLLQLKHTTTHHHT